MPRPTRREKAVIVGAPTLLLTAFLVRLSTRGAVSLVALGVYLIVAAGLVVWIVRKVRARDREASWPSS